MTNRVMYDFKGQDVDNPGIPDSGADIYATYGDGLYEVDNAAFVKRFGGTASRVLIDVTGAHADTCTVLDYEPGDANQATAIEWVQSFRKLHGYAGTVYLTRDEFVSFVPAAAAAGQIVGKDYMVWLAAPADTAPAEAPATGIVAVQWKMDAENSLYDESVVFDEGWHANPKPASDPATTITESATVTLHVYKTADSKWHGEVSEAN